MTNNARAIASLCQIMLDDSDTVPIVQQIDAAEQLLNYEAPPDVVERAKAVLTSIFENGELLVSWRLDALKLMRKCPQDRPADTPHEEAGRGSPRGVEALREFAASLEIIFGDQGHTPERLGRRSLRRHLSAAVRRLAPLGLTR